MKSFKCTVTQYFSKQSPGTIKMKETPEVNNLQRPYLKEPVLVTWFINFLFLIFASGGGNINPEANLSIETGKKFDRPQLNYSK